MVENNGYNPYADEKQQKDAKTARIIITVALTVIIAVFAFFAGFFTQKCTMSKNATSLEWALSTIKENYYFSEDFDLDKASDLSLKAIAQLLDPYSEYYTLDEYMEIMESNAGKKSGVGISYNFVEGRGAYIVTVVENSPACAKGIRPGDVIISGTADGKTTEFSVSEDFTGFIEARETGEKFTLSTAEQSFEISKEMYTESYAFMAMRDTAWECVAHSDGTPPTLVENRTRAISYLPEGSAYVNLSQFFGGMADEFGALMTKFNAAHCTSLYIDLRNNGGGYVNVMQDIAGYFTSSLTGNSYTAMTAEYKNGKKEVFKCYQHTGDGLVSTDTKVYVLANSYTASASEAFIGVLVSYGFLDYENIFISNYSEEYMKFAGSGAKTGQTYGKGIMQSPFVNWDTGDVLKLTTAQIYWPNGKCIHRVALSETDHCTLVDAEWTATKGDTEFQRVVELTK